ncbi:(Fe-S)-binding protein [Oleiagrimonas sp. C23AA]|uniref:(Fe-S)-binding protein n=1 Tax=Oleiagrimonas sp. C23AA TaxID=2719047 RepID=UPI0014205560|nr:(Fe-S)-binding protein [Oleiagrimonas sp. C23AA]NII10637.1 (Fe-S)-binding protein [Oleiagrimonas sp. C23AA]
MKVALFVPCFINVLYPKVGIATLELLEKLGCEVVVPPDQTCCGQPMATAGCHDDAAAAEALFVDNFAGFEAIIGPSASCVQHIRKHLFAIAQTDAVKHVRAHTFELVEFVHDILAVRDFPWARLDKLIGLHNSCSALRSLDQAATSELPEQRVSKARTLLEGVAGIRFAEPKRPDECCGFGGVFSVFEEAVSVRMGQDKVADHAQAGAELIVSADTSCLMHQQGCAQRQGRSIGFAHIAQVLNGDLS